MAARSLALHATLAVAIAIALAAPAGAAAKARPSPTPTPGALPIQDVTVEIQPLERAPGMPAQAPAGSHVEQPPAFTPFRALPLGGAASEALRGFAPPRKKAKPRLSPSPSPTPGRPGP